MVVMKTREEEGGRNGGESEKRGASRFTIWAFTFCDFSTRRPFLGSERVFKELSWERREGEGDGKSEFALIIHQSF